MALGKSGSDDRGLKWMGDAQLYHSKVFFVGCLCRLSPVYYISQGGSDLVMETTVPLVPINSGGI